MSEKTLKRPEALIPAGTLEKLKTAIDYGIDAVLAGGQAYGLRNCAGNFTMEELQEGIDYAHAYGAKVHVAANMVTHEGNGTGTGEWFRELRDMGLDAVIVSDLALMVICLTEAPGLEVHVSTRASAANCEAFAFWEKIGVSRVVLTRGVGIAEIEEIHKHTSLEIETFVHGVMYTGYSGRCVLSNHTSHRDANRGGCLQPCHWKYDLYDMLFGQEHRSLEDEIPEPFSMSSVDTCMIEHLPDLTENGVDSFKIEGCMGSIHYISAVASYCRTAVDVYLESPAKFEAIKGELPDELWKVAQRGLATGFRYQTPTENEQLFGIRRKTPQYKFVGEAVAFDEEMMTVIIRQRSVILEGNAVEFYGLGFRHFEIHIKNLHDANGNKIDCAPNPMELLTIIVPQTAQAGGMIRARKEGLVNPYKSDDSSKIIKA